MYSRNLCYKNIDNICNETSSLLLGFLTVFLEDMIFKIFIPLKSEWMHALVVSELIRSLWLLPISLPLHIDFYNSAIHTDWYIYKSVLLTVSAWLTAHVTTKMLSFLIFKSYKIIIIISFHKISSLLLYLSFLLSFNCT